MKFYAEMNESEVSMVDLVEFTRLKIGDRISHVNAGQHGGNGTRISSQLGTVIGHNNEGLHFWGGLCVTIDIKWDDQTETRMVYSLAKKI